MDPVGIAKIKLYYDVLFKSFLPGKSFKKQKLQ